MGGWGFNMNGQLGDGHDAAQYTGAGRDERGDGGSGIRHTLYVKMDGTLWAMGDNFLWGIRRGTTIARLSPVQVADRLKAVAAGDAQLVREDGRDVWRWATLLWELGDGTTTNRSTPVQVANEFGDVGAARS